MRTRNVIVDAAGAGLFALVLCSGVLSGAAVAEVRNPKGVAVIIGNVDYEHRDVPDVAYAGRDAEGFRRYVVDVLGFAPENVLHVTNATRRKMFDVLGTRSDPRSALWAHLHPDGGSEVVVFYSGHGVPGTGDRQGYLLPVDADPKAAEDDGYPINLLYGNLGKLEEASSVRVYLDACFSGASHEGGLIGAASPVYVTPALPEGTEKVVSLSAATGKQIASWDEEARHGLFTHHLLDALYGRGDADGDGEVTAGEAKGYLDRHMTRAARREHRRVQEAHLSGAADVVLASAGGAGFPARPDLDRAAGPGPEETEGKEEPEAGHATAEEALGLDRDARMLVQRSLGSLGFDAGPVDGAFGPKTRGAIGAWQEAKGYDETGYLTEGQAEVLKAFGREAERERYPPGKRFRDCAGCPWMVVVPEGSFLMGSPKSEAGRSDDEGPRHRVAFARPFAVSKHEVTRGEFARFVSERGRSMGDGCWGYEGGEWDWRSGKSWENPGFEQTDEHPVVCVSWEDARAYVEWLSEKTGKEYRLLSESEWEYVARGGRGTSRYWGEGESGQCRHANGGDEALKGEYADWPWAVASCNDRHVWTSPVGTFEENGFGLHDVLGNVWEWVGDCYHDSYEGAPADGSAWESGDCERRVLRGGSWFNGPGNLRSANRSGFPAGYRLDDDGFRVARTLTP